jgi:hypothetical protein
MLADEMRKLAEENSNVKQEYDELLKEIRKAAKKGALYLEVYDSDYDDTSTLMYFGHKLEEEGFEVCMNVDEDDDGDGQAVLTVYWA